MTDQPTEEQQAHAILVQYQILENIGKLINEGIDVRVILAGVGSATASLIATTYGFPAVAPWFANQALLCRDKLAGN